MQEILTMLLQAVITAATPIVAAFAVRFLNERTANAKASAKNETAERYIGEAADAVTTAVALVSQTYADALKASGAFTLENQREAFNRASNMARSMLTAEASRFITEAYGDLQNYLTAKIEAEVFLQK